MPSDTFIHMIGKDTKKLANIGTLVALNQIRAIRIMDITGVDRIMIRKGSNNF